jgi:hypothetical protein
MSARAGFVDIVRDFIVVHQRFATLFERFRTGVLHFEEVQHLVADSDSSVLFRLKERVHRLFRERDPDEPLRRGEALFDLAVGSLFHEALKFRENLYQLEVYGPKVRALRAEGADGFDELLAEFEKILLAASDRLGESLRETETLLEQTRRQLLALLRESMDPASSWGAADAGLVTRYLLEQRKPVEDVYPEGIEALLVRLHGNVLDAYLCAIRSHLESAHFREAIVLIEEARERLVVPAESSPGAALCEALEPLEAYARGMRAFLEADYPESLRLLGAWLDTGQLEPVHVELASAVLQRVPTLVDAGSDAALVQKSKEIADRLA